MTVGSKHDAEPASTLRKVLVRFSDGRLVRAYLAVSGEWPSLSASAEMLPLQGDNGVRIEFNPEDIKAIFVVKSFEGNPNYVEFKNFPQRPGDPGLWVRVRFMDQESLEGVAPNSLATFADPIFVMTPPDPQSNNQAVLVSKRSLAEMQILGFEES